MALNASAVFHVICETEFGSEVRVVGSSKEFGSWDPARGIRLRTTPSTYPLWWSTEVEDAFSAGVEFKFVTVCAVEDDVENVQVHWETVPNRVLPELPAADDYIDFSGQPTALIVGVFGSAMAARAAWLHLQRLQDHSHLASAGTLVNWPQRRTRHCGSPLSGLQSSTGAENDEVFGVSGVAAFGSFTDPPWTVRVPLKLCSETLAWWIRLEDVVGELRPGVHELKLLVNEEVWVTTPTLPECTNGQFTNNLIVVRGGSSCKDMHDSDDGGETPTAGSSISSWSTDVEVSERGSFDPDIDACLAAPHDQLCLLSGAFCKPKARGGENEDSYFMEAPATLGVADGVGGLGAALGHSSKAFADEIMDGCRAALTKHGSVETQEPPSEIARKILCEAFEGGRRHGASTAVIAHLNGATSRLGIAAIGDSVILVIRWPTRAVSGRVRRSSLTFKSPVQQHSFNHPFQLCRLPEWCMKMLSRPLDQPSDCITVDVEVEKGDLVLACSDGVVDNLHDEEVLNICDRLLGQLHSPASETSFPGLDEVRPAAEEVARAIGLAAYHRSLDTRARTPFAMASRSCGQPELWWRGGKADDITCVAAWVASLDGA
mmetsp:Transcript_112960/g.319462  ORF Transcript_112960/g.319462 Transcript_112960/m.319462 type:complete len:603 (+) Transcript_112960:132-1940(+)